MCQCPNVKCFNELRAAHCNKSSNAVSCVALLEHSTGKLSSHSRRYAAGGKK